MTAEHTKNKPETADWMKSSLTRNEKIETKIFHDADSASIEVAREVADTINRKSKSNEACVLGLATGSSPKSVYAELVRMHNEEGLSFKNVITFNLDEYHPINPDSHQSYVRFMNEHLFDHVDIKKQNIHIPDGTLAGDAIENYCKAYEDKIEKVGGIDIQLLGIGRTGHVGFNEPGSFVHSYTRLVMLDHITRQDAASDFFGIEKVPKHAITMGIGTILASRRIILLAWGEGKSSIIKRSVEGEVTDQVPATFLQHHTNTTFFLDSAAASELSQSVHPWLYTTTRWDNQNSLKAVVWLSQRLGKPILKLTDRDYIEYGMGELIARHESAYNLNLSVFNKLQHTITGWPGGKPNADDTYRPERAQPAQKRVLIFSPHPDDDVISMGGTLLRLVDQGHDVHIAYQTSGNIAVFDDDVVRLSDVFSDLLKNLSIENSEIENLIYKIRGTVLQKKGGEPDTREVLAIKEIIRKSEAKAACRFVGVPKDKIRFLKMPFYETGNVKKSALSGEDYEIIVNLLREIKPHQIYAAGDLSDPHGTHRQCLKAIVGALEQVQQEDWYNNCWTWLYRGAWQEWPVEEIDMAVPISPEELMRKRKSIFKHQSQKDSAPFPGNDSREFWQRSEDRNRKLARIYDSLGLAEYEAMEGFKRLST